MTDKAKRTIPEIQQEFSQACAKAGHLQYQIYVFGEDLKLVNEAIKTLNFEAAAVSQDEAKKAEEAKNNVVPITQEGASS